MAQIRPHTLSGFMELLPEDQKKMQRVMATLRESYALYGFTPLDTPVIESADVLLAKGGGETEKQIYRFTKGDSDLALRFDLTVPLAKYVALHANELTFPFRRYQIGKVYRGERAQRGRFRRHLPHVQRARTQKLPHPREQPQGPERLFRSARADGEIRRRDAHDR